jgi:hypothetical protein
LFAGIIQDLGFGFLAVNAFYIKLPLSMVVDPGRAVSSAGLLTATDTDG